MIVNKLRITEEQFNMIHKYLVETKFNDVIKDTVKPGDVIKITYGNVTSNFKVLINTQGQIQMDNIDSGSTNINYRYFITQSSLEGNQLEIRRVHKLKEKDKLNDVKSWKLMDVKGITNIEIFRDNQLIDRVDEPKAKVKPQTPNKPNTVAGMTPDDYTILENVKDELLSLKEYHTLTFDLVDGTKILFCASGKNNMTYELEVSNIDGDIAKYDTLRRNRIQMHFNESIEQDYLDDILFKKGNDITLLLHIIKGEELIRYNLHFTKVQVGGPCSDVTLPDEESDEEKKKELEDAKQAMNSILTDPDLKNAFYSQPSLWNLFKAELTGKKATGKGIITVMHLVNTYEKKKVNEKLSKILVEGKPYKFMFLNRYDIRVGGIKITKGQKDIGLYRKNADGFPSFKSKGYELVITKSSDKYSNDDLTHYDCNITSDDDKTDTKQIHIQLIIKEK